MCIRDRYIQNVILTSQDAIEGIPQDISQLPTDALVTAIIVWGIIGFICLILFTVCLLSLIHIYGGRCYPQTYGGGLSETAGDGYGGYRRRR